MTTHGHRASIPRFRVGRKTVLHGFEQLSKKAGVVPFNLVCEQRKRNWGVLEDARTARDLVRANAALKDLAASGWLIRALRYRIIQCVAVMLVGAAGACGGSGGGKSDDDMVQRVVVKEADGERERARSPMDPVQGWHTGTTVGSPVPTTNSAHTMNIINITNVGQLYATDGTVEIGSLNHDRGRKRRSIWRTGHSVSEAVVKDLNVGVGEHEARISAVGVQTGPEPVAQVADASVQTEPEPVAQMTAVGVQTEPEPVAQMTAVGVQTEPEPVAQVAAVGVQTEPEPVAQVAAVGVQTEPEPVAQVAAVGVQTEPEPVAQVAAVGVQTEPEPVAQVAAVGVQTEPEPVAQVAAVGVQTEPEPVAQVAAVGVQTEPEPVAQVADAGVQTELMEAHEAQGQYIGSLSGNYNFTALVTPAGKFYAIYAHGDDIGEAIVGDFDMGNAGTGILYLKERLAIKVNLSASTDSGRSLPSHVGSTVVSILANQFPSYQSIATQADNLLFNSQSIHIVASADGLPPLQFQGNADLALHTKPTVSKVVGTYKGMFSKRDYLVNEINMPSIIEMIIDGRGRITGTEGYCPFVGKIVSREWGSAYDIEVEYSGDTMCSYPNSTVRGVGFYIEKERRLRVVMQTPGKGGMLFNMTRNNAR
ncbi:hypothetical protein [Mycetohabitans rhizoxinica]|uniref:hypothetical protein n=1 Tax=Mycetohabitans rhizoxinica TaxID=412963 RepID=UPI0030D02399